MLSEIEAFSDFCLEGFVSKGFFTDKNILCANT